MKREDIFIRDPFVLTENGKYYLYGSRGENVWEGNENGFDVYVSNDLENFDGPFEVFHSPEGFWADKHFWAPEVHKYNGRFYMFASLKKDGVHRGTQVFVADSPMGPFSLHSDGPVTPRDWECLDGTLYVDEEGTPFIVFCHEWTQVVDGEVCVCQMTPDLKGLVGTPKKLFNGSDPAWTPKGKPQYVTDGPFIYTCKGKTLLMIWSGFSEKGYVLGIAKSENGIMGPWEQDDRLLFNDNGGHGMIFRTYDGKLMAALHMPNNHPNERPAFIEIYEKDEFLYEKKN